MRKKAQISLEFLIVFTIAIITMCFILPSASKAYNKSLKAIDLANAKLFASELQDSIRLIAQLSEGSQLTLKCSPFEDWKFSVGPENITILVNEYNIKINTAARVVSKETNFSLNQTSCLLLKREKEEIFLAINRC
ncbi:MAG: hypothetical protein N3F05_02305 [Candidatus Diapherotrites archaeon]|nr:hypothetical protein [Candidatus Diapherotrites archaeon]